MNSSGIVAKGSYSGSSHSGFWALMIFGILILSGLFLLSQVNFLLFHVLIELFSIAIMWAIFILVWNTRNIIENYSILFLGIAFFFIGVVDTFHVISYKGMGIFPGDDPNPPTQFWILGRYLQGIAFFTAPLFWNRQFKASLVMVIFAAITTLLIATVFGGIFPDCFVQESGLTAFKKNSEYIISLILIAAMWQFSRLREHLEPQILKFILISLSASVLSELFFTFYISVFGVSNVVGHCLKIIAILFLYKALIRSTIKNPFNLIFRELKENEDALRVSEEQFSSMFRKHGAIMLLIEPDTGEILEANSAAVDFYGYPHRQLCEMNIDQINTLPAEKNSLLRLKALESKQNHFTFSHRLASGETRDVEVHSSKIISQDKKILFSIIHDITSRKKTENDLRESENRYRSLIEDQTDLVCRFTSDGTFVFVNDVYCKFFNISQKDLIGSKWQTLLDDGGVEHINNKLSELSDENPTVIVEASVCSGDGKIHWIHISNSGVFDSQGNLLEIQSVGRDITNRKISEEALLKSEARFSRAVRGTSDGIWDWNVVTNEDYLSPRWKELLGYAEDELINEYDTFFSRVHPDDVSRVLEAKKAHLEQDFPYNIKHRLRTKNGVYKWFQVRGMAERDEQGKAQIMSGSITDITESIRVEAEKEELEKQLQQAQKMESIGNLAGGIAHDFNNILSAIIGYTELALGAAPKGSSQKEDLEEVYIAGNRAKELVQQILAFARQSEKSTKPIKLSDIVTETLKLLRPATPTSIDIKPTINSASKIMGNNSQLHQIVMNLCTNAIHSLQKSGGVLQIALRNISLEKDSELKSSKLPSGKYVELTVSDNGPGIAPTIIENIFDPYFTTKGVGEGSGMGLAMVKGIVESYGGDIEVQSELGEKTTFTIRFPVATGKMSQKLDKVEAHSLGTERILFVDDEPPIARMGGRMLESLGYTVTIRTSSFEALDLFKKKPDAFDLLITDMTMPSMTGDMLSTEVRKVRHDIPIIICTGYSNQINEAGAQKIGIEAFVYKPLAKADLAKTVREVLATNQLSLV